MPALKTDKNAGIGLWTSAYRYEKVAVKINVRKTAEIKPAFLWAQPMKALMISKVPKEDPMINETRLCVLMYPRRPNAMTNIP